MSAPVLHIDFETRSELDLREVGLYNYSRHPSTDVWCMAWAIGDEEPSVIPLAGQNSIDRCHHHITNELPVLAHNAPFELAIWNNIMVPRYGWPVLKPEQTYCTMAQCYAQGLPGALEDAALALGLHVLKDAEGRSLMLRMARPRSTNPTRWWDEPEKLARLYAYCQQDVRVERELHKRLMPLSDTERKVWLLDYKINQRGVQLDIPSVKGAIRTAEQAKLKAADKLAKLTKNAVQSVTALTALKEWIAGHGIAVNGLAKADVADLLAGDTLTPRVAKVLEVRQEAGKASAAKFDVMAAQAGPDGRLRNMYQYHGAATGRWAGRAVQTHNLPRDMPPAEDVEKILYLVRRGEHDALDMIFGSPLTAISRCLRSFFVAPPGKLLVSGDFNAVESRCAAWFANEKWKLDVFFDIDANGGPDVYMRTAGKILGKDPNELAPGERQRYGKTPELAFQYGGSFGAWRNFDKTTPEAEVRRINTAWREAHPRIVASWRGIERAAIHAVREPGSVFACGHPGREAKFKVAGSFLWLLLPSGRAICYPYPKLLEGEYGPQLTYMTVPSQADKAKNKVIVDPQNSAKWVRVATYGGSLFNNIVQGFARDLLVHCMLALDEKGAAIVLHTHDDLNMEVPEDKAAGARAEVERIMRSPPAWAKGLPLYSKPAVMRRYGK